MSKHHLIAYRDDRSGQSQPITFVGDGWREYIPMVLPWTTCVRDRVPPGRVAVLINRAHVFNDLALAVDSSEDRFLQAIDGRRTVGEILHDVGVRGSMRERAGRDFFERLWQYDQIAVDASCATPAHQAHQSP
jgi:hypothetical protein